MAENVFSVGELPTSDPHTVRDSTRDHLNFLWMVFVE